MSATMNMKPETKPFGIATRALAGMCHHCVICPFADRKPHSPFGRIMRWHRNWCPGYLSHIKVYGRKNLS